MKFLLITCACSVLLFSCSDDTGAEAKQDIIQSIAKPNNLISIEDASKLYSEFGSERAQYLQQGKATTLLSGKPYQTTRKVYMKISDLENYIDYVKEQSAIAGITPESLGFFFMKYPDDGIIPSGKNIDERAGTENLMISPLAFFKDVSQWQIPYVIQNNNNEINAIPVGYVLDKIKNRNLYQKVEGYEINGEIHSLTANDFPWTPPPNSSKIPTFD